jgi:hypothetical protein
MKRLLTLAVALCALAVPVTASAACPPTNDQMGCSLAPVLKGISAPPKGEIIPDVSSYQLTVNWAAVKAWEISRGAKLTGGIFKLGENTVDPYALQNATDLHRDGMIAVGYWFVRPTGAYEEAGKILTEAAALHIHVVVLDEEVAGIQGYAQVIAPILKKAGYEVVDYHSQGNVLDSTADGLACWTADYGPTLRPTCTTGKTIAWQLTDLGSIPGIHGLVDESISYGLLKLAEPPKPTPKPAPKPKPLVCFGRNATPRASRCQAVLEHYDWLVTRRNFWRSEFSRCIRYAEGIKCGHAQHWAIVRGEQTTQLRRRYS